MAGPTPLRHDTSNREGHTEFDIRWHDPEPTPNVFTSVIRVKNEAQSLPWVLPPLLRVSERVVLIDNGSDDGTPDLAERIAKEEGCEDRFELLHYPFSVGRCGPEHLSIPPDSVHSLAYFYNWSFSHVRTKYGLKWDGDMVITEEGERYFRNLAWQVRHIEAMIRIPRYPVYIESDRVAYVDGSMKNFEPWAWPNLPGYHLIKAFEWELISTPPGMTLLTMPEWTAFELKWLGSDEFTHWSEGTDFFASKRTERKAREWQVYHASLTGEVLEGVHRVESPPDVHIVDFLRRPEAVKYARIFL